MFEFKYIIDLISLDSTQKWIHLFVLLMIWWKSKEIKTLLENKIENHEVRIKKLEIKGVKNG